MSLATSDVEFLQSLVAKHSGNIIAPRQVQMLEQRLGPIAQTIGLGDVDELVAELRRTESPVLSTQVAEAVTVNETSFFRDMHVFESLRNKIIPNLVKRNEKSKRMRIWSAACSSGQEPYSIAMVIQEHFPHLSNWKIRIAATDLSEEMLNRSRAGEYSKIEIDRGVPAEKAQRFFDRSGSIWRARRELRDMIDHRRLNLTEQFPFFDQFDVIFIRNVLIYVDRETRTDIIQRVRRILRPDGYLFIGSAETLIGAGIPFQREQIDATVCYRPTAA